MKVRLPKTTPIPTNLSQLAHQAQKMQDEVEAVTAELEAKDYTVTTGGSAVTIVMSGKMEVKSLKISPEVVDPEDVEMLSDLVTAAVNETINQIKAEKEEKLSAATGGFNVPGMM